MRNAKRAAMAAIVALLGACSKEPPLPVVADADAVTKCAFVGRTVGDARAGTDEQDADRAVRELQARKRALALGGTHVVWDTSGNFKGDAIAAKVYRCQP